MQEQVQVSEQKGKDEIFSGNVYIFHAFDVGDDINLEAIKASNALEQESLTLSKYFKNYHIPLAVKLPQVPDSHCVSIRIHNFGAISLTYKIPFKSTLSQVRTELDTLDNRFRRTEH